MPTSYDSAEPAQHAPRTATQEWRRNWTVVLAAAVGMGLVSVPTYSMGIFMQPLEQEFGWSRSAISSGKLFGAFSGLLLGPVIGMIIDKSGPKRLAMVGSVVICGLFAALALTGPDIRIWWGLWAALALGALLIKPTIWTAGVSSVFSQSRGLALAVTLSGTVLASAITPILGNYLIEVYGWRLAYLALALIWAIGALPLVFIFFDSAHDRNRTNKTGPQAVAEELTGVSAREGLLSIRFVKLAIGALLATMITASFITTLVPILTSHGHPTGTAAKVAGLMGVTTVAGRLISGYLADRMNANIIGSVTLLLPIAACLLLVTDPASVSSAMLAACLLGATLGAKLHFVTYLTTRHFGMRSFGVLFGTIAGLFGLATGLGPVLLNYSYDLLGNYDTALLAVIPVSFVASLVFLTLGKYPDFDSQSVIKSY